MRRAGAVALLAAAGCGGTETATVTVTRTATERETVTATVTVTERVSVGLPEPVAEKRAAMLEAAEAGDADALAALAADDFTYSFGAPAGGPARYWRRLQAEGERPLATLAALLRLPYTLHRGTYVWPFAFGEQPEELTAYERELLGGLADDFAPGTGYLGWRAGIEPDGDWIYFVAGD